jgi:hypothetical protein
MSLILFPVGRMIGGSLKDMHPRTESDGRTPKIGADGKPLLTCNFGVAIPKSGEASWNQTAWGQEIFNIGKTAEPVLHQSSSFAWKIVDGDDTRPNKNGKIPAMQEGYAGHWVVWFSQGWLPKLCNSDGSVELPPGSIMPGQYVQVQADVAPNGAKPPNTPGLYLNPRAVALVADGDRIVSNDVDTTKIGFGASALPPGARPIEPAVPGFGSTAPASVAPVASPVSVTPNAAFMAPPAPPASPAPLPPLSSPAMTEKAGGIPHDQWIARGWTDDLLRQHGMMI